MNKHKTIRVLIAEDDFLVAKEIQRNLLHLGGYEVIGVAGNGEKALEMVCSVKPDLLLLDIQMPQMNGLDVAKKIQELYPTPIIIVTAYESKEYLQQASEFGVGAYLTKPIDPITMQRSIIISMARHQDLMQMSKLYKEIKQKNEILEKKLAEIKVLQEILPICANCKKIRDDNGYWKQVDQYMNEYAHIEFSHGICPECMQLLYPEYLHKSPKEKSEDGAKTKRIYVSKEKNHE